MRDIVIDSLIVKGFKLFEELKVPKLSRLNLFVGSNNTGKSCLLEAVRLFATEASLGVIRDLIRSRDEDWELHVEMRAEAEGSFSSAAPSPIWSLFNDSRTLDGHHTVEIGPLDEKRRVVLSIDLHHDEYGRWVLTGAEHGSAKEEVQEMLGVYVGGERTRLVALESLFAGPRLPGIGSFRLPVDERSRARVVSVDTDGIKRQEVNSLWDRVSLTPLAERILGCLRLIDPRIDGIAFVGDSDRTAVLRLSGMTGRVPLKSMGDGLTRLFHIALAMVNAEDGIVLIDEFENGLYWEVQAQLWPVVFQMAEALNVQVFATSHSNDCIKGFERAWANRPELGTMYRLERTEASVNAFRVPVGNLSDALASLVEVR